MAKRKRRSYERKIDQPVAITPVEYGGLQEAYDHFNAVLFDGKLGDVFITYQRKSHSRGYFAPERFSRKTFPASNFPEFVNYMKKNSAKLQFGSAGAGTTTHLGCALLNAVIGVNAMHVPYRGGGPAVNDLIGGQIDYMCLNMGIAGTLSMGNQIKAIAMLSRIHDIEVGKSLLVNGCQVRHQLRVASLSA
jgi:Tripartite tricarboxylate transporter family receptor